MNSQRPDDRRNNPQYVKGGEHRHRPGWHKWLWLALAALVLLGLLSMCGRDMERKEGVLEGEVIEEQTVPDTVPPDTTPPDTTPPDTTPPDSVP
ncbi:hypothetical protein [Microbulbifer magnicolonia]|uniref:hypothetical protein n=1 Tax=Microbulbifer magnicolonia TaxID=3109744 RepID=UPI002B416758|nr:hypothetical protein [Microbulbifer sp. GG15]